MSAHAATQSESPLSEPLLEWCRWDGDGDPDAPAEEQLERLAGAVGPLRRVLAAIAERLTTTRAWERLCYARVGDYARERAGLSGRQLQELARVHRVLAELPALERALLANELPWSKVRVIARVASREDGDLDEWIARARSVSTRRLEHEARAREPSRDPDDSSSDTRVTLRCTPAVREKWTLVREVAERVEGERLGAGEALERVAAEAFSTLSIDPPFAEMDEPTAQPRPLRAVDSEDGNGGTSRFSPGHSATRARGGRTR